jgi:hypothetical protein
MTKWRRWALRAIAAFAVVYGLGLAGVPTLVPYLTALLLVAIDGWRTAIRRG